MLSKFANPESGAIKVDDVDLRGVSGKSWRQRISVVTQEALLFHGSIADNIVLGDDKPDWSRMMKAAEAAHVLEFVEKLPAGMDSLVGNSGGKLSGGQRQRVALARALYRDADLILLDEATSALDASSESVVQQALDQANRGRTVLVIAHRMSTIRDADLIVVMEKGRVVEQGTHQVLMTQEGRYAELHHLQHA